MHRALPAVRLRRFGSLRPRVIVVGASTGGPQALLAMLTALAPSLASLPVVIVLHIPQSFIALVSEHLSNVTGLPVSAAEHGETLQPGHVYFAAGGVHSKILRLGDELILAQSPSALADAYKPAVDVLFRSAADACGPGVLGIVLTGMGSDGLLGATAIVDAGGSLIAQDEVTSVVWGMPGSVARAGLCAAVASPVGIATLIANRLCGGSAMSPA